MCTQPRLPSDRAIDTSVDADKSALCPCMRRLTKVTVDMMSCCTMIQRRQRAEHLWAPLQQVVEHTASLKGEFAWERVTACWAGLTHCKHVQSVCVRLPVPATPLVLFEHGLPAGSRLGSSVLPLQPALRALHYLVSRHVPLAFLQDVVDACAPDWRCLDRLPAHQQQCIA